MFHLAWQKCSTASNVIYSIISYMTSYYPLQSAFLRRWRFWTVFWRIYKGVFYILMQQFLQLVGVFAVSFFFQGNWKTADRRKNFSRWYLWFCDFWYFWMFLRFFQGKIIRTLLMVYTFLMWSAKQSFPYTSRYLPTY